MLESLYFIIVPILLLPIWIMLIGHPWKIIRFVSKLLLFLSVFGVITGLPILLIIKLNYWVVILFTIIIGFRIIDVLVNKLNLSKSEIKYNEKVVFDLTISSFISTLIIFLTLEKSPWFGLWFSLFFFLFIGTGLYRFTQKYKLVYGAFFGFIVLLFPYNGFNVNSTITLAFSFSVTIILMFILNKVTKRKFNEKYEIVGLGTIIILSLYLLNAGGIPLVWAPLISSTFIFIMVNVLIICSNKYISQLNLYKIIKQYFTAALMLVVVIVITYFVNKSPIFKGMVKSSLTLIYLEAIVLVIGRILGPLLYRFKDAEEKPHIDSVSDTFSLLYGKNIGSKIFSEIFGESYKEISTKIGFLFACVTLGAFGMYLAVTYTTSQFSKDIVSNSTISMLIFLSLTSGLSFFLEVLTIAASKDYEKGMTEEKAVHCSAIVIANYTMCGIPFILFKLPSIKNVNIIFVIFIAIEIFLYLYNINMGLFVDFCENRYNNLRFTRRRVTVFLLFIGLMTTLAYIICIYNTKFEIIKNVVFFLIILPFVSTFLAKLIGYDNEISGEKVHKECIKRVIILILYFVLYSQMIKSMPLMYSLLTLFIKDQSSVKNMIYAFLKITSFGNILIVVQLFHSFAIAVLPKTNNSKDGLLKLVKINKINKNNI